MIVAAHGEVRPAETLLEPSLLGKRKYDRKNAADFTQAEAGTERKRRKQNVTRTPQNEALVQDVLLLHGVKQKYTLTRNQAVPEPRGDYEMLVRIQAIGLNPIDWKAPDFGFGLPELPCICGRDLAGAVVKLAAGGSRVKKNDLVMAISTDYRDSRKSAYQEYAVVSEFNACRIPKNISPATAAPLGVAFVAAALALGICLGLDFSRNLSRTPGPDLLNLVRNLPRSTLPSDIHPECFENINENERPRKGDWLAIWGGSSATGICAAQLAKLLGMKVICVLDVEKNGSRMLRHKVDLLVDRLDTARAVSIVKSITGGQLRFGIDTRGKESVELLASAMRPDDDSQRSHVVGLTGLPKEHVPGIVYHSVPIKAFHEARQVGEGLMVWLEKLLDRGLLATPDIEIANGGLGGINDALDRLRDGSVSGPRLVVPLEAWSQDAQERQR